MLFNITYSWIKALIVSVILLPCIASPEVKFSNKNNSSTLPHGAITISPIIKTQHQLKSIIIKLNRHFIPLNQKAIQKFAAYTTNDWHRYLSSRDHHGQQLSVHLWSQASRNEIFLHFNLYQFPVFRDYISKLEGYHEAIVAIHEHSTQDKHFARRLANIPLGKRYSAHQFLCEEALKSRKIIERSHIQQAAIVKQKQAITLCKAQIQATISAQQEELNAIVDTARSMDTFETRYAKNVYNRAEMIQKISHDNGATSTQKYVILPATQTLLGAVGINPDHFTQCHGNALQQHIHNELISNLNRTALLHAKHDSNPEVHRIAESVVEFTHVGIAHNNAGHVIKAMTISNLVSALTDYGCAIAQGVGDGVTHVAHAVLHPIDTATNIARSAAMVGYHLGKVLYEVGDIAGAYMVDPVTGTEKIAQYGQNISAIYREIQEKYDQLSGPEMVRAATAIATETWLTGKCLGAAKTFYGHAQTKALEFTKKIEQGLATAPELLASAEGFEVLIANEAAETMMLSAKEGFNVSCRASLLKACDDMKHYAEEFKELGLNEISKRDLKHIFKNHVPGGQYAQIGERSTFYENVNIIDLAIQGWKNGTETVSGTKIFDTGKLIGLNIKGIPTSKISISLNGTNEAIKTIFPI